MQKLIEHRKVCLMKLFLIRGVPAKLQQDGWWMDADLAAVDHCPKIPAQAVCSGGPSVFSVLRRLVLGR